MARIKLTDTAMEALIKMVEGNPGATHALMDIIERGDSVDPQAAMGGFGVVLSLDTLEIYGTEIYILYNDQCNRDSRELMMLLRAHQLGFINTSRVKQIASDQTRQYLLTESEMGDLNEKVCSRLNEFEPRKIIGEQKDGRT